MNWNLPPSTVPHAPLEPGRIRLAREALALNPRLACVVVSDHRERVHSWKWSYWERSRRRQMRPAVLLSFVALGMTVAARALEDIRPTVALLLHGPTQLSEESKGAGLGVADPIMHELHLLSGLWTLCRRYLDNVPFADHNVNAYAAVTRIVREIEAHLEQLSQE